MNATKLLLAFALLPGLANAAQVITAPSADTPTYSFVVVDAKKLRTPLSTALAAYPGEECLPIADVNVLANCPGITMLGLVTYNSFPGFPAWPDPNDPRKELRIDGLKTKDISNVLTPGLCGVDPFGNTVCSQTALPPMPITITFNRPTTEFGFMYLPIREGQNITFITGFNVSVNGVSMGFQPSNPTGVQYWGVSAPEGLVTLTIDPVSAGFGGGTGPIFLHRLYYK